MNICMLYIRIFIQPTQTAIYYVKHIRGWNRKQKLLLPSIHYSYRKTAVGIRLSPMFLGN